MKVYVSTKSNERRRRERRLTRQVNGNKWVMGVAVILTITGFLMTKVWTAHQEAKLIEIAESLK